MHSPNVWARDGNVSLHLERFRYYFLVQNQTAAALTINDINELLASSPCTFDHVPEKYIDCHIFSTPKQSIVMKSCPKRTRPYSGENILTDALVSGLCIRVGSVLFFKAMQGTGYGTYGLCMHGLSPDIVMIAMTIPTSLDRKHGYGKVPKPFYSQTHLNGAQELLSWMHRALQGEETSLCIDITHERHGFQLSHAAGAEAVVNHQLETANRYFIDPINDAINAYTGTQGQLKAMSCKCERYYTRYIKDYTLLCCVVSGLLTHITRDSLEHYY